MRDDQRWQLAPGLPWRATRLGVVVSVPDGTVVAPGLAAAVLVRLPATTAELAAALPEAAPADLAAAVDDLVARGVVMGGGR